jgi:hypothetical protein
LHKGLRNTTFARTSIFIAEASLRSELENSSDSIIISVASAVENGSLGQRVTSVGALASLSLSGVSAGKDWHLTIELGL